MTEQDTSHDRRYTVVRLKDLKDTMPDAHTKLLIDILIDYINDSKGEPIGFKGES